MKISHWKLSVSLPWILVAVLAISNGLLINQNFKMRGALEKNSPPALEAGEGGPSFNAKTIDGNPVRIDYPGQGPKKVLFYFTPPCKFCLKQFAYWRSILAHADANQFEVIGLVREPEDLAKLKTYLSEMGCAQDSPVPLKVVLVPEDVVVRYKLSVTPVTLIVSNSGTVEKAWMGLWNDANISAASSAMGIAISSR